MSALHGGAGVGELTANQSDLVGERAQTLGADPRVGKVSSWRAEWLFCSFMILNESRGDFPGDPVVKTLFLMHRVGRPSLTGEFRSHVPKAEATR